MRILVTGGAGFIGSHTCDRLILDGHDIVVLDALTRPVHQNGRPSYLTPGVELYIGDVRNRELVAHLLRRVDAVYHFAAYQDYLTDFARFTDVNVTSTAMIYEIIVSRGAGPQPGRGCLVAGGHGRGLYSLPAARRADTRHEARVCAPNNRSGISPARCVAERWRCNPPRNVLPTRRIRTACRSMAKSVWRSTSGGGTGSRRSLSDTALCKGPGNRSSTPTPEPAEFSTCTTCSVARRPCSRMGRRSVTTSTFMTWWMPTYWCLPTTRAVGRVFNVGGGTGYTTEHFADIVRRQYDSDLPGRISGEYRFGDTRHILSDIDALGGLGLGA